MNPAPTLTASGPAPGLDVAPRLRPEPGRRPRAGAPAAAMDPDALTHDFLHHRPRLFGIAYRMLGSAWDAEDVVADAMVRWMSVDRRQIREPVAFLTTVVTRLAIDRLRSARAARETYVGEWLPEPVATDPDRLGPLDTVERRETVSLATLRMMEALTPPERAVLVLHEAFELSHAEIAAIIGISEVGARQHLRRARRRLERGADVADRSTHDEALDRFLTALEHGHLSEVQDLLAADVASYSDGGGKAHAARRPVVGAAAVVHYLDRLRHRFTVGDVGLVDVNGWPAATLAFGRQRTVLALDVRGDGVREIQWIMNPDKLRYLGDQLSASRAISPRSRRLESTGTGRFRRT